MDKSDLEGESGRRVETGPDGERWGSSGGRVLCGGAQSRPHGQPKLKGRHPKGGGPSTRGRGSGRGGYRSTVGGDGGGGKGKSLRSRGR